MIVVDTSIWLEHLRVGHTGLAHALNATDVALHPWVLGELVLGGLSEDTHHLLRMLPRAAVAEPDEVFHLITSEQLANTGIGWVDAQLLASARLTTDGRLATADRKLHTQAQRLGLAATLRP